VLADKARRVREALFEALQTPPGSPR